MGTCRGALWALIRPLEGVLQAWYRYSYRYMPLFLYCAVALLCGATPLQLLPRYGALEWHLGGRVALGALCAGAAGARLARFSANGACVGENSETSGLVPVGQVGRGC